jgi:L,D-peptidoglycan transpeptidase YkuD (ErfK/YbiS/YcfS/YnhG family)
LTVPCALGRGGISRGKREGDGATPAGRLVLRRIWYRADRVPRPRSRLPVHAIRPDDGWCDAAGDRNYNRPVRLPYPASHERLWRDDHVYDVVVELGWNERPRVQGRGSAIFLHLARPGYAPTEGCVALARADMLRLLPHLRPGMALIIS